MSNNQKTIGILLFLLVFMGLSACSMTAKVWKPYDEITVETSARVNPDTQQRPSPIQVKIYELTSRATFDNLDFDRAFHSANTLLSDQLLSEIEYTIQPGESITHTIDLQAGAAFIAIVASFIDIDNARWKHIYKVKDHGHYTHHITISDREIKQGKPAKTLTAEDLKKGKEALEQAGEIKEAATNLFSL